MTEPTSSGPSRSSTRTTPGPYSGAALVAIVAVTLFVSSCDDTGITQECDSIEPPVTSVAGTSPPTAIALEEPANRTDGGAVVDADLDTSDTSIGTLWWTRVTGDADSVPLGVIEATSDGELVVFEREFVWRSTDGLDWSRDVNGELERLPGLWVEGNWAIKWGLVENDIYESVGGRWQELDLPAPQLPKIPGLVWHVESRQPVESSETTLIPWHAVATVAWGEVEGLLDTECAVAFTNFLPQRNVFFVSTPDNGKGVAEFRMRVTGSSIVFFDVPTGEEVHRIVAESPDQAEFIAEQMKLPYSSYIEGLFHTGAWVRQSDRSFDIQTVPWSRPPRSVVALPSGGFAAYQNTQRDGYTPGDSRVWTSSDGLSWIDHGRPAFPDNDPQPFFIETTGTELRAKVGGTVRFTSCDGLTWTRFDVSPVAEVAACRHTTDADFGTVATERSAGDPAWRFSISVDGNSWEEVEGPPGPHRTAGAGFSKAGAAQDLLWLVFGDYGDTRTVWIGRFD